MSKLGDAVGSLGERTPLHPLGGLGAFLREQRLANRLTLRELAEVAGVSNPYLSQIERGLRRPSTDVLQALAQALKVSVETVYQAAGVLPAPGEREPAAPPPAVEEAIAADLDLTPRQKQSLLEVYRSFRAANPARD